MSVFYDMEKMISLFCLFLFTRGGWEKQVGTVVEAILSFISRLSLHLTITCYCRSAYHALRRTW